VGLAGRIGLFEMLWVDRSLARLLARGAPERELNEAAGERMRSLRDDGIRKLREGLTTLDEVLEATVIGDA
jgi:type II secretory ATPase GspE/PulE/Tfp pilus assembly ATPase PilB-like protein